jgi:diguanylate cyclase
VSSSRLLARLARLLCLSLLLGSGACLAGIAPLDDRPYYLEDPQAALDWSAVAALPDARWQRQQRHSLSLGFTDAAYWFRLDIPNRDRPARQLLLEVAYPLLDSVQLYTLHDGHLAEQHLSGDRLPASQREIQHSRLILPVNVAANADTRLLLRVHTRSVMQVPLRLWTPASYAEHNHIKSLGDGLLYGFLFCFAFYHLALFFSLRERLFLYLTLYAGAMLLALGSIRGSAYLLLWPGAVGFSQLSTLLGLALAVIFSCLFSREILQLQASRPLLGRLLLLIAAAGVLLCLALPLLPYQLVARAAFGLALCSLLCNSLAYVWRALDRFRPALYLVLGALTLSLSTALAILIKSGRIPDLPLIDLAVSVAVCLQFLLFSFALASRLTLDRSLRKSAEAHSREAQQALLNAQIEMTQHLDQLVRQRTEELDQANQVLQQLSITDSLTQLFNRRHFDQLMEVEFQRAGREQTPLALLVLDIDHFKAINDTHGHAMGDLCLQQAADCIRQQLRRVSDIAARYGGEEFVVLLPNTPLEGAQQIAEQIRQSLAQRLVQANQLQLRMTVSIGVACAMPPHPATAQALFQQADARLYQAKRAGRDRVVAG